MKKIVKNYLLKMSIIVMTLLMVFPCVPVKASTGNNGGNVVSPCGYFSPGPFSFTTWTQNVNLYDGTFMAVEVGATSTVVGQEITVEVYVDKTGKTHTYKMIANGLNNKFDYIYLGLSGGSDVAITLECSNPNAVITAKVTSYSW